MSIYTFKKKDKISVRPTDVIKTDNERNLLTSSDDSVHQKKIVDFWHNV